MRQDICTTTRHRLLCLAGGIALTPFGFLSLHAQQPVLAAAASRASLHRVLATQIEPDPGLPGGQSTPTPPTPPAPGSMKDDLFAGTEKFAKNASDATEVNMDPDSLNLVNGPNANRARRTLLSVVRSYSYDKPGMYNPADVEEYRRKLETGDWHCSVHTRDLKNGESTDICSKRRGSDMIENAIITVSPKALTFIHNIRRADGQGGSLDLDGNPGISMLPALSPELPMMELGPAIRAQIDAQIEAQKQVDRAQLLASEAELRSALPELNGHLLELRRDLPGPALLRQKQLWASKQQQIALKQQGIALKLQSERLTSTAPALSALREQHLLLQRKLRTLQVPTPPVPGTPLAVPPAPTAPAAPSAPDAPSAPAAPPTPAVPHL